ncbi:tRNA uridine-5-carboxymethylaminomethyl(34) synthesis GTPase MnmE [Endomicrobium proavitum]|uniref:tRNA modification GTPase MnmE n=1 Tax=Endomicrobium proavitum TaxID=1408281 RepID=A0A0G3WM07_9BACT|nr:tRNA uridine-5-carboxymethylaminomethyl(34) synthesis GTPase MnmE [Endomicrobium proavitum]AKL98489.1 tRNA modification GTPase [Endomicrobium proavitum]
MNYNTEDTIAALSTAAGKAAIAVIRLSGKRSFDIIGKIFETKTSAAKQVQYGCIVDGGEKIDEVLCAFFKNPNTYTGEDIAEISCHGNPVIINKILNLLYKTGARQALPGEFTYRGFINGKMDLTKAESVCALITSKTETAAKAALNNVSGEFANKIKNLKNDLTNLLAFMEVSLDHPEEDIMFLSRQEKQARLTLLIETTKKLLAIYKISESLQKGLKAAIIGKPNAGKSSLLNAIVGKNRAIVTDIAGTTTDTIEEFIDCRGVPLTIIDTAGIRTHSDNSIELLGQKRSKEAAAKADVIIWVLDGSAPFDNNDKQIADFIKTENINTPILYVLNKADLERQSEKWKVESEINDKSKNKNEQQNDQSEKWKVESEIAVNSQLPLKVSSLTGDGIPALLNAIAKIAGVSDTQNDLLMINSRHYAHLENAFSALTKAKEAYALEDADEIAAFEARATLSELNEILGITTSQDILDTIFSNFCIGK